MVQLNSTNLAVDEPIANSTTFNPATATTNISNGKVPHSEGECQRRVVDEVHNGGSSVVAPRVMLTSNEAAWFVESWIVEYAIAYQHNTTVQKVIDRSDVFVDEGSNSDAAAPVFTTFSNDILALEECNLHPTFILLHVVNKAFDSVIRYKLDGSSSASKGNPGLFIKASECLEKLAELFKSQIRSRAIVYLHSLCIQEMIHQSKISDVEMENKVKQILRPRIHPNCEAVRRIRDNYLSVIRCKPRDSVDRLQAVDRIIDLMLDGDRESGAPFDGRTILVNQWNKSMKNIREKIGTTVLERIHIFGLEHVLKFVPELRQMKLVQEIATFVREVSPDTKMRLPAESLEQFLDKMYSQSTFTQQPLPSADSPPPQSHSLVSYINNANIEDSSRSHSRVVNNINIHTADTHNNQATTNQLSNCNISLTKFSQDNCLRLDLGGDTHNNKAPACGSEIESPTLFSASTITSKKDAINSAILTTCSTAKRPKRDPALQITESESVPTSAIVVGQTRTFHLTDSDMKGRYGTITLLRNESGLQIIESTISGENLKASEVTHCEGHTFVDQMAIINLKTATELIQKTLQGLSPKKLGDIATSNGTLRDKTTGRSPRHEITGSSSNEQQRGLKRKLIDTTAGNNQQLQNETSAAAAAAAIEVSDSANLIKTVTVAQMASAKHLNSSLNNIDHSTLSKSGEGFGNDVSQEPTSAITVSHHQSMETVNSQNNSEKAVDKDASQNTHQQYESMPQHQVPFTNSGSTINSNENSTHAITPELNLQSSNCNLTDVLPLQDSSCTTHVPPNHTVSFLPVGSFKQLESKNILNAIDGIDKLSTNESPEKSNQTSAIDKSVQSTNTGKGTDGIENGENVADAGQKITETSPEKNNEPSTGILSTSLPIVSNNNKSNVSANASFVVNEGEHTSTIDPVVCTRAEAGATSSTSVINSATVVSKHVTVNKDSQSSSSNVVNDANEKSSCAVLNVNGVSICCDQENSSVIDANKTFPQSSTKSPFNKAKDSCNKSTSDIVHCDQSRSTSSSHHGWMMDSSKLLSGKHTVIFRPITKPVRPGERIIEGCPEEMVLNFGQNLMIREAADRTNKRVAVGSYKRPNINSDHRKKVSSDVVRNTPSVRNGNCAKSDSCVRQQGAEFQDESRNVSPVSSVTATTTTTDIGVNVNNSNGDIHNGSRCLEINLPQIFFPAGVDSLDYNEWLQMQKEFEEQLMADDDDSMSQITLTTKCSDYSQVLDESQCSDVVAPSEIDPSVKSSVLSDDSFQTCPRYSSSDNEQYYTQSTSATQNHSQKCGKNNSVPPCLREIICEEFSVTDKTIRASRSNNTTLTSRVAPCDNSHTEQQINAPNDEQRSFSTRINPKSNCALVHIRPKNQARRHYGRFVKK